VIVVILFLFRFVFNNPGDCRGAIASRLVLGLQWGGLVVTVGLGERIFVVIAWAAVSFLVSVLNSGQ
jgi:hypothetical protein